MGVETNRGDGPRPVRLLSRSEAHALTDGLLDGRAEGVEVCIAFIEADTKGDGHGRARAMMCRQLKHCALSPGQRDRLVGLIAGRLAAGTFAEQFRDELRLALRLDAPRLLEVARACLSDPRAYVRRCAEWVLRRDPSGPGQQNPAADRHAGPNQG